MFWYSGLSRIRRAVTSSGAWRTTRLYQDCFVSSTAAHVVLPTPPDPQAMTISRLATSWSSECDLSSPIAARPRAATAISSSLLVAELGAERLGDVAGRAQAVGPGEEIRDIEHGQP